MAFACIVLFFTKSLVLLLVTALTTPTKAGHSPFTIHLSPFTSFPLNQPIQINFLQHHMLQKGIKRQAFA